MKQWIVAVALIVSPVSTQAQEVGPNATEVGLASGDWGYGSYRHDNVGKDVSLPTALDLPDLIESDGVTFRFSSAPSLGGEGYVITLGERLGGTGHIEAIIVRGHPGLGWKEVSTFTSLLSAEEYSKMLGEIEALYTVPDVEEDRAREWDGVISLCSDGPGLLSEMSSEKSLSWIAGSCGKNHPNRALARLMRDWVKTIFVRTWAF